VAVVDQEVFAEGGGGQAQRRTRKDWDAAGAEGEGCGERVCSSPLRLESGEGAVPPIQKKMQITCRKGVLWCIFVKGSEKEQHNSENQFGENVKKAYVI